MTSSAYFGNDLIGITIPIYRVEASNSDNLPEIESVDIPEGITVLGPYLFEGSDMTSFTVPDTVTSIEAGCFYGCSNLETIVLPQGLKYLGPYCFDGCSSLTSIELPDSLEYIGPGCFSNCGLISIDLPDAIKELPECCFYMCGSMRSIKLPTSLVSIGPNCFEECGGLENITFPQSLKRIANHSFWYCGTGSIPLRLPASIEYIGSDAFENSFFGVDIWFEGNIPKMDRNALTMFGDWNSTTGEEKIYIHYPVNHPDWTEEAKQKLIEPEGGDPQYLSYYGIGNTTPSPYDNYYSTVEFIAY